MKKKNIIHVMVVVSFLCFVPRVGFCEEAASDGKTNVASEDNKTKKVKYKKIKGGLKNLLNFARSRKSMVKELNQETENYENIKKAIKKERLEKGMSTSRVQKKYGKGVIILSDDKNAEVWVYKKGTESHFTLEKIYLNFDAEGKLIDWRHEGISSSSQEEL